jgi:hypothetical protein
MPATRAVAAAVESVAGDAVRHRQGHGLSDGSLGDPDPAGGRHGAAGARSRAAVVARKRRGDAGHVHRTPAQRVVRADRGATGVREVPRQCAVDIALGSLEAAFGQEERSSAVALALSVDQVAAAHVEHLRECEHDGGD